MSFEDKKQEIIDELNRIDPQQMYVEYAIHKICELKPEYPTCSTCNKLSHKEKRDPLALSVKYVNFYSCELLGDLGYASPDNIIFGCNQHSELEINHEL